KKAEKAQTEKEATEAKKGEQVQANPSAKAEAHQQTSPPNLEDKLISLSEKIDRIEADIRKKKREIKKIQSQVPDELDYAEALQSGMEYFEQLDRLHREASASRIRALSQIEFYRVGLGPILRRVSDEIIEAEYCESTSERQSIAGIGGDDGGLSGGPV